MNSVRIAIGCDHAGYELKRMLVEHLRTNGDDVVDFGTESPEPVDYPDFCAPAARAVSRGEAGIGIVLGGSGQGEQIVANKVRGIRAALCNTVELARLARKHNDANVLAMGARIVDAPLALEILRTFLDTPFAGGRHVARLQKIADVEAEERFRPD
jgi:ribose 5-phosphate isomerase B